MQKKIMELERHALKDDYIIIAGLLRLHCKYISSQEKKKKIIILCLYTRKITGISRK